MEVIKFGIAMKCRSFSNRRRRRWMRPISEQNDEECDATKLNRVVVAGYIKNKLCQ